MLVIENKEEVDNAINKLENYIKYLQKNRGLRIKIKIQTDTSGQYSAYVEVLNWPYVGLYHEFRNFENPEIYPFGNNYIQLPPTDRLSQTVDMVIDELLYVAKTFDLLKYKQFTYEKVFEL